MLLSFIAKHEICLSVKNFTLKKHLQKIMLKIIENLTFNYLQINKTKNVSTSKYLFSSIYTKGLFKEIISKKKSTKTAVLKNSTSFEL